ncbi:MAG: leucine-rich repeat protein [Clostridiales bacterium]|nr:leucine-rich repeat protein [Clostridiales bacterium]
MKRILSLMLCVTLLLCSMAVTSVSAEETSGSCGDGVTWSFDSSTGTLSIEGSGAMTDYANVLSIPWKSYCPNIKSVSVGEGVTKIGSYSLTWCEQVTSITLPSTVKSIGRNGIAWNESLKTVTLPEGLETIGEEAFACCYALSSVTIPSTVTEIESTAFLQCSSLSGVNTASGSSFTSQDGVLIDQNGTLLCYPAGKTAESYTVPSNVKLIDNSAFRENKNLKTVSMESVTEIGERAFMGCSALSGVSMTGVSKIGAMAFYGCESLLYITIPESVNSVGEKAFRACSDLRLAIFENSGTTVGDSAFRDCSQLTIVGGIDSKALTYANSNNVPFYTAVNVVYNGEKVKFDPSAFIVSSGVTMVPMRGVFEMLGAEVSWDGASQTASASKDGTTVSITIGSAVLYRNGEAVALSDSGKLIAGKTYVPLRAVSEAFGNTVDWDHSTKTVTIY